MIVNAWSCGSHKSTGAGYGLKIKIEDRDLYFDKSWKIVLVELPNGLIVEANVNKSSFWNKICHELINKEFGLWFLELGIAPWNQVNLHNFN